MLRLHETKICLLDLSERQLDDMLEVVSDEAIDICSISMLLSEMTMVRKCMSFVEALVQGVQ